MITEEKLVKIYIAEDGMEFLYRYQCESYEKELHKETQRFDFLNKIILEEMKKVDGIIPYCDSLEEQARWIDDNLYILCDVNRTEIGYLLDDSTREEFDENCPFDIAVWHNFEREIEFKYNYQIKDPSYYWCK